MNKSRRERRREKQGKTPKHVKRFRGIYTTQKIVIELLASVTLFSVGLFLVKDFFVRLNNGQRFWCEQRHDSSCISGEVTFGAIFILGGICLFAHMVYIANHEYQKRG